MVALIFTDNPNMLLRPGKSMLIPSFPFKLNLSTDDKILWNACVGPTPHIELAMKSLSFLFNKYHFINGTTRTLIPYRDW